MHLALLLLLFLGLSVSNPPPPAAILAPPTIDLFEIPLPPPLPDETEGGPPRAEDVVPRPVKSIPTAEVAPAPSQTEIVHTLSPLAPPAPTDMGAAAASSGNDGNGNGLGSGTGGRVVATPGPASRARRLAGYIASVDYPAAAIALRAKGTTGATLSITPTGKVGDCRVTTSSGHGELDSTVCRLARERFRYRPARDTAGRAMTDTIKETFTWVLPQ